MDSIELHHFYIVWNWPFFEEVKFFISFCTRYSSLFTCTRDHEHIKIMNGESKQNLPVQCQLIYYEARFTEILQAVTIDYTKWHFCVENRLQFVLKGIFFFLLSPLSKYFVRLLLYLVRHYFFWIWRNKHHHSSHFPSLWIDHNYWQKPLNTRWMYLTVYIYHI